jgi:hypothetical protein
MANSIQGQNPQEHFLDHVFIDNTSLLPNLYNRGNNVGPDIFSELVFGPANTVSSIYPSSIVSEEAFGSATVELNSYSVALDSQETFSVPQVQLNSYHSSIISEESVDQLTAELNVNSPSVVSEESHGVGSNTLESLCQSISSEEAFGLSDVRLEAIVDGIGTSETLGTPRVSFILSDTSIASDEAHGTGILYLEVLSGTQSDGAIGTPTLVETDIFIESTHHGFTANIGSPSKLHRNIPDLISNQTYKPTKHGIPVKIGKSPQRINRGVPKRF